MVIKDQVRFPYLNRGVCDRHHDGLNSSAIPKFVLTHKTTVDIYTNGAGSIRLRAGARLRTGDRGSEGGIGNRNALVEFGVALWVCRRHTTAPISHIKVENAGIAKLGNRVGRKTSLHAN